MSDNQKILVGHGPQGLANCEMNWTQPDEPVNGDGYVCCNKPICSCYRSFTGIHSGEKTTMARVVEIPRGDYDAAWKGIHARALAKFSKMPGAGDSAEQIADFRRDIFKEICEVGLRDVPVGTIVRIKKDEDGRHYDLILS